MPHDIYDPIDVRQDIVKTPAGHDVLLTTQYDAGTFWEEEEKYRELDIWRANRATALLMAAFPGYFWSVRCETVQGIMKIFLPILGGVRNCYRINLVKTDIADWPKEVVNGGGILLECYRQSRSRFDLGSFLEARQKHSALVRPWLKIPV